MKTSTRSAVLRVGEAESLIEQAGVLLDRAAQRLSAIRFGATEAGAVAAERERVYALAARVRKMLGRDGMSLDSEPEVRDEQNEGVSP